MQLRILLLILHLIVTTGTYAEGMPKVGSVCLGIEYKAALSAIRSEFGEPVFVNENEVEYKNIIYRGFKFDTVVFKFKASKFNEARFFIKTSNKHRADKNVESLSRELKKDYLLSKDFDDNSYFYKGGLSPMGIGPLFTISAAKRQGIWSTELRYGPF